MQSTAIQIQRRAQVDDSHLPMSLPPSLRQVLARRGVKSVQELELVAQQLRHFAGLQDVEKAAARLGAAIETQQRICIVGDFDVDGATSTSLMLLALREFGAHDPFYIVPNRFTDGYGLTPKLVEAAAAEGAQLIVTVDNGVSAFAGVERANALDIDVIITDHHLPSARLPDAYALVNPTRRDCNFGSRCLAGVGVAFYLLLALRAWYRGQGSSKASVNIATWLDLVALGTVADVVPLDFNNRILVQQGLARIRAGRCRPGILALLQLSGRDPRQLQASDLGFTVAPRINAAGRLDDIQIGIECLLSDDADKVQRLAEQLDSLNRERRSTEHEMREDAAQYLTQIELDGDSLPAILSLHQSHWHQGVIGILAGRVKEQVYRPVIAFAQADGGVLKGSARSIPGVHIRDVIERVYTLAPHTVQAFGGHAMAAGLSVPAQHFDEFKQHLAQAAEEFIQPEQLQQVLLSDGELSSDELSLDMARQISQYGPWGQGFSEPLFDGLFKVVSQRIVGDKHLKLVLQPLHHAMTIDAIAFGVDLNCWPDLQVGQVHIAYRLQVNEFRGRSNLQLLVEHIDKA